jgi:hypothetical protein
MDTYNYKLSANFALMAGNPCTMVKLPGICSPEEKIMKTTAGQLKKNHQGSPGSYTAKATATAKDCLTRQVREAVHLRRFGVPTLNGKTEWHQPALVRIQI